MANLKGALFLKNGAGMKLNKGNLSTRNGDEATTVNSLVRAGTGGVNRPTNAILNGERLRRRKDASLRETASEVLSQGDHLMNKESGFLHQL